MKCGLLGKKLGHSFSPMIHSRLGDYEYDLYEKSEEELEDFIKNGDWDGLNVTVPYKKEVFKFLDEVSETAKALGSVNTVVKRNGKIYGDNTDVYGFEKLLSDSEVDVKGKKTLVLGSGGASVSVKYALLKAGADVTVISRSGENNYENIDKNADAKIIVNTTPVGMYPNNLETPLDVSIFKECEACFDIIYNPHRTKLMLDAEENGIKTFNGLMMLVAQAVRSSEIFTGSKIDKKVISEITAEINAMTENIVLIGMPGCGKSLVAKELSNRTGKEFFDSDEEVFKLVGRKPAEIIKADGEEAFRAVETKVLSELGKKSGIILATGGGCVTRKRNYPILRQNGCIVRILRSIDELATDGRPLSEMKGIQKLAEEREEMYCAFADCAVENNSTPKDVAEKILCSIEKMNS